VVERSFRGRFGSLSLSKLLVEFEGRISVVGDSSNMDGPLFCARPFLRRSFSLCCPPFIFLVEK